MFVALFTFARSYFIHIIYAVNWGSKLPLFYKFAAAGLVFLHLFWLWEVLHITIEQLAQHIFPSHQMFGYFYGAAKRLRPYRPIYIIQIMIYC